MSIDWVSWRNYKFLIALVILLAAQVAQAQGSTYPCDARLYQLRQPTGSPGSFLYLLDRRNLAGGGTAQWASASSAPLNALGYNKADGFFYAVNVNPITTGGSPYRLYRLGTTGSVEVASLDGGSISTNAIPNQSTVAAGTVDRNGKMYIKLLQSDTFIYTVQLPTTSGGAIGAQGKITLSTPIPMADMAFDPITNRLYGVYTANIPASDGATTTGVVYDIDPSTGTVVTKGTGPGVSSTNAIGSAFFDVSGTLYAYQNGGVFGTIDLTTGNFTRITAASAASQSDGASCVFPDEVISVTKASGSVEAVSPTVYKVPYTVTVQNTGSIPDRNVQITEDLAKTFSAGNPTLSIVAGPTITAGTATANTGFDGTSDTRLLSGTNPLAAGSGVTVSFTVQVTYPTLASVPTAATSNIVQASSTSTGPNTGYTFPGGTPLPPVDLLAAQTSSPTPVVMVGQVDLAITKTGPATAVAGTSISYLLKVSNAGPSSANGATFSDAVPSTLTGVTATCQNASTGVSGCAATVGTGNAVTGSVGTLPSGGSVEILVTGVIPSAATASLSNTATVAAPAGTSDTNSANNSSTVTTALTKTADLAIDKSAPVAVGSNGSLSYTVRVWNNGPSTTSGVGVNDTIPSGFTVTGITCAATGSAICGTQTFTASSITITTGNLTLDTTPANATPDGNFLTYTITGTAAANGSLSNTASLTVPSGTTDSVTGNNTSGAAVQTRILDAVNDAAVSYAFGSGGTVSVLGNDTNGGAAATTTNSAVTISSNGGITGLSVTNGQLVVPTNTPVGTYTVTYQLCDSALTTACDTATVPVTVYPSADLAITKTDGVSNVTSGTNTTYTIRVTNTGPSSVTGAVLKDPAATGLTQTAAACTSASGNTCTTAPTTTALQGAGVTLPTLASGAFYEFTVTASVTAASGSVTNTATVAVPSGTTDPTTSNNSASDTDTVTTLVQAPVITLRKLGRIVTPAPGAPSGHTATTFTDSDTTQGRAPISVLPKDIIEYCIVYKNTGGQAPNFKITDYVPVGMVIVPDAYGTPGSGKGILSSTMAAAVSDSAAPAGTSLTNASDTDAGTLSSTSVTNPSDPVGSPQHPGLLTFDLKTTGLPASTSGTVCFQTTVQ